MADGWHCARILSAPGAHAPDAPRRDERLRAGEGAPATEMLHNTALIIGGTIVGALILTVISALLTSLGYPEAVRQVLYGSIIVIVAAAYTRVTGET